jgi:hypothetical protein
VFALAEALKSGHIQRLEPLLHENAEHRDLASGAMYRGKRESLAFFARAYLADPDGHAATAEVVSARQLTAEVAIVNLALHPLQIPRRAESWPPFTVALLVYEDDEWAVAATRAGGNYDTLARGRSAE